jgi:hypothetical protein
VTRPSPLDAEPFAGAVDQLGVVESDVCEPVADGAPRAELAGADALPGEQAASDDLGDLVLRIDMVAVVDELRVGEYLE